MVKRRTFPIHFIVAHFAVRWELCRGMCRIGRGVVVLEVTGHAGGGSSSKALRMTLVACQRFMPTVQRKTGSSIVVKGARLPSSICMAGLTIGAEPSSRMHRIGCCIEIFQMAGNAGRGSSCKSLRMTLNAT